MNKTDIIREITEGTGLSKAQAGQAFQAALCAMTEALNRGERVQINGFGTFVPKSCPARQRRNPKSGAPVWIAPHQTVVFKAGCNLCNKTED